MSEFTDRITQLQEQVGKGLLHGEITFDQVYARYAGGLGDLGDDTGVITPTQESHGPHGKPGLTFDHPRGGEANYLGSPLTEKGPSIAQEWADSIGSETPMETVMIRNVEEIAADASARAPREFFLLNDSDSTRVISDGHTVYDRPAVVPRAPESLLRAMKKSNAADVLASGGTRRPYGNKVP